MITQIIWFLTLPVVIFLTYRIVLVVYRSMEKKKLL
jgi:hypothetical protein